MHDHGEWHSRALCKLTQVLLDKNYEVYSQCMTPELEIIDLAHMILDDPPNKLGISLFVGEKSRETMLGKPDLITVKNNKVQHIIEIEESKNPAKFAGLIVANRVADLCTVNSPNIVTSEFEVRNSILHILYQGLLSDNVKAVINNVIQDKGNLLEIRIMQFEEFVTEMEDL
jgi:hypothetical protein